MLKTLREMSQIESLDHLIEIVNTEINNSRKVIRNTLSNFVKEDRERNIEVLTELKNKYKQFKKSILNKEKVYNVISSLILDNVMLKDESIVVTKDQTLHLIRLLKEV